MGKETDTYVHQNAGKIKYQNRQVTKTPRGTKNAKILCELKIDDSAIGEGKDNIYVFTDRTYPKKVYSL